MMPEKTTAIGVDWIRLNVSYSFTVNGRHLPVTMSEIIQLVNETFYYS